MMQAIASASCMAVTHAALCFIMQHIQLYHDASYWRLKIYCSNQVGRCCEKANFMVQQTSMFESLRTAAKTYSQVSIVALLTLSLGSEAREQRLKLVEIVPLLKGRKLGSSN